MNHDAPLHDNDHDDFGGLHRDTAVLGRRRLLKWIGGASLIGVAAACGGSDDDSAASTAAASTAAADTEAAADTSATTPATTAAADTTATAAADTAVEASAGTEIPDETQRLVDQMTRWCERPRSRIRTTGS